MGKHKDECYGACCTTSIFAFSRRKAIPKDLSDAFVKQFLQGLSR